MSVPTLEIAEPGIFTTVQDRGRYGYQRYGVPVSGAMDEFALRAANLLVGNDQGASGLEITVLGPEIRFLAATRIAITGGDLSPQLNGEPLPRWITSEVPEGAVLSFHGMQDGMRAYLAIRGGVDVPLVMGSRSTYVRGAIGGLEGRALRKGDVLSALPSEKMTGDERRLHDSYDVPVYGEHHEVRVVLGPQDSSFGQEAIDTLLASTYVVSLDSDRMGYRMEGPAIQHQAGPDIVSDGSPLGAVQVPGDGVPTILMADRGTTGGYAKIATVIGADIGNLAQSVPGQTATFNAVSVDEAHAALREREATLSAIKGSPPPMSVRIGGEAYEAINEEGEVVSQPPLAGPNTRRKSHRALATISGQTYEFEVEVEQRE